MTRVTVREYAASLRPRYQAASRKVKKRILDEFCETTRMHRKSAIRLLKEAPGLKAVGHGRPRRYGPEVAEPLAKVWEVGDRMCGKLLAPVLPDLVTALERHGEIALQPEVRQRLLEASPSTIDRLLRRYKTRGLRQPRLNRLRSSGLKAEVPLRTWSEWKDVPVGSVQADLVLHCGDSTEGFYLTTLCAIDVATGWTELQPVWGMSQENVVAAIHLASRRLPFRLQALHTDNGGEFLNHKLVGWCRRERVSLTRGRSYRKNDQAYVEQRNWQTVRRQVGYDRLSSKEALTLLEHLYGCLRLQLNFYRPVRKLIGKERHGARVRKRYDEPRTPYQRLLAAGGLTEDQQTKLAAVHDRTNPAELTRRIQALQRRLWHLGQEERRLSEPSVG